jgi:hypothetical protein
VEAAPEAAQAAVPVGPPAVAQAAAVAGTAAVAAVEGEGPAAAVKKPVRVAWLALGLVVATLLPATPASAATEIPVLTTSAGEFQPAKGTNWLAWEQNTKEAPRDYDVFIRRDGGPATRVNEGRSNAAMGGIDGELLVYQQFRKKRSNLVFHDLATGESAPLPDGINTRNWEYWPSLSHPWLLYGRLKKNGERVLLLHNLDTGEVRILDKTRRDNAFIGPGQVNGNYAVWSICRRRCNVFRYDISAESWEKLSHPPTFQRAPSVTPGGTVYLSRGGKQCGDSVRLVRVGTDGSEAILLEVPDGLDIRDTYVYVEPNGSTEVYFERSVCGRRTASDVFKVREAGLASLRVTKAGTGSGTVTSSPSGINCGSDCAEDYEVGTAVTLHATPAAGSVFVGWSGSCGGTGACQLSMAGARSVTAIFEPPGSITIRKDAQPNNPQDFTFRPSSNLFGTDFVLDDDPGSTRPNQIHFENLTPGSYTVEELGPVQPWQFDSLSCEGSGNWNVTGQTVTVTLELGETATCTFTNIK